MLSPKKRGYLHKIIEARSKAKGIDYAQAHTEVTSEIRKNPAKRWIIPVEQPNE